MSDAFKPKAAGGDDRHLRRAERAGALLFVYGTLMPDVDADMGQAQRARLNAAADVVGPARISGRLFDFGAHPAAVLTDEPDRTVSGVLLALHRPATTWRWLDPYESIRGAPEADDYRRVSTIAELSDGRRARAWVYDFVASLRATRPIESGVWRPR
ncbi:MAG: gamma-glutamylcyclotransferase family protein [Pseudomonadota bacterium]